MIARTLLAVHVAMITSAIVAACATTDECCCNDTKTTDKTKDELSREEKARLLAGHDRLAIVHWKMQYQLLRCEHGDVASCAALAEGGCSDACRRRAAMVRAMTQLTNTDPHPLHRTELSKDAWVVRLTLVPPLAGARRRVDAEEAIVAVVIRGFAALRETKRGARALLTSLLSLFDSGACSVRVARLEG